MSFLKINGRLNIEIHKADGSIEKSTSENLIVEEGAKYYDRNSPPGNLMVGTGTIEPTVKDTVLSSYAGILKRISYTRSGTNLEETTNGLLRGEITTRYEATQGSLVGNFTEFGLAYNTSPTAPGLFSHGLFTDSQGVPTSITVSAEDQLVIYYTLEYFVDLKVDIPVTLNISGQVITGTLKYCYYPSSGKSLGWGMAYNPFSLLYSTSTNSFSLAMHGSDASLTVDADRKISGAVGTYTNFTASAVSHSFFEGVVTHTVTYTIALTESILSGIKYFSGPVSPSSISYKRFIIELDTPFDKTGNDKITATAEFKIGI